MKILKLLFWILFLSGCGSAAVVEPRSYDLGLNAPSTQVPPVRLGTVRAVAPFDGNDMQYRLSYRNAAEIASFANSRWAASPAEMLRKQILRGAGETQGRCLLDVEVQEFTQVFASEKTSEARIELRASLANPSASVSKVLTVTEPNAGPDAATGAGAFARAADRAIAELSRWISTQPACN